MSKRRAHVLWISGELIREVTKPVNIPRPGVRLEWAARLLGRTYESLRDWDAKGVFGHHVPPRSNYDAWLKPWERPVVRGRRRERGYRRRGRGEACYPRIYTNGPIDPNGSCGRPPHPVWGTLWQWHWEQMRRDYDLLVKREPCFRRTRWSDRPEFRGWNFVCPGRVKADGTYERCGRRCHYLYFPLPVSTIGKFWGDEGFELPPAGRSKEVARWRETMERQRAKGKWRPGQKDLVAGTKERPRCFACKQCWRVRGMSMTVRNGWNEFVTAMSGGLLRGMDVPMPKHLVSTARRKKPFKRRSKQEMEAARRKTAA